MVRYYPTGITWTRARPCSNLFDRISYFSAIALPTCAPVDEPTKKIIHSTRRGARAARDIAGSCTSTRPAAYERSHPVGNERRVSRDNTPPARPPADGRRNCSSGTRFFAATPRPVAPFIYPAPRVALASEPEKASPCCRGSLARFFALSNFGPRIAASRIRIRICIRGRARQQTLKVSGGD